MTLEDEEKSRAEKILKDKKNRMTERKRIK